MITAYKRWLMKVSPQIAEELKCTQGEALGRILIMDCMQNNPQAFDIVGEIDNDGWDIDTFTKAGEKLIEELNLEANVN
jgi:hypothetical protein